MVRDQVVTTPWCCLGSAPAAGEAVLLYVNNSQLERRMYSKTSGPVHDANWSLAGYRV